MLNPKAVVLFGGAMLVFTPAASAQLIDAGQQAMIMHQGNLLEQQTAPNNPRSNKRIRPKGKQVASVPSCSMAQSREALRPEYERRLRSEGQAAATAWLRQAAAASGREAGAAHKAGVRC